MSETDNIKNLINTENNSSVDEKKMSDFTGQDKKKEQLYGDALNDNTVNNLVDDINPHVVVLVGFPKYGKSTFVSSLYHAVMKNGSIGKYKFVDSETILGFERRAHIRREELRINKRLDRTPIYADYFLSLVFLNSVTKQKIKLVLSDRSGENYKDYGTRGEIINSDKALNRAQHIIFFLDAYAMATDGFLDMQQNLGLLVSRMINYGTFKDGKRVDVVFNKTDLLTKKDDKKSFISNKEVILRIIKQGAEIHKESELSCLGTPINDDINKFFEYLLDSCVESKNMPDDIREKVDWVGSKLKELI